ncbi:MAG TPA: superoxide dismutase family protein [Polyangiaceae bacterium]|nr:superoxide dismutase family protein [Polyangiaceae bacterium]
MSHAKFIWSVLGSASLALAACGGGQQNTPPEVPSATSNNPLPADSSTPAATAMGPKTIEVTIQPKSNSNISGKATFTEVPEGVKVTLALANVPPGEHGAHVHEKGDCSDPEGKSAGGHFNPANNPHALPSTSPRHLGDLGNITVDANGKGTLEIVAAGANLKENDPNSFLGRAIIIHEKKDDGGQPTGNAGGRIGCGEIK